MGITVGGHGKGPRKRRTRRFVPGQPAKPFRPTENPFPEKEEFQFGTYRIIEEKDDYLICEGYDPRAKNPFAEYTPDAIRQLKVAKPPLLLKSPWDGQTVSLIVDGTATPVTFQYTGTGKRTATAGAVEEVQRITMDYFVGDSIVAVQIGKNAWQQGMVVNDVKVQDENGANLSWVDLNVSGRCWAKTDEEA